MENVLRFWCYEASNIRCVREFDYDTALIAIKQSDSAYERLSEKFNAAQSELAALREELAKYKSGCVDLSSQVRELEHKMDYWKGEGKRADDAQQRLTAAEQRNAALVELLSECEESISRVHHFALKRKLEDALKPTESGANHDQ